MTILHQGRDRLVKVDSNVVEVADIADVSRVACRSVNGTHSNTFKYKFTLH
jgi:hypothetical protein